MVRGHDHVEDRYAIYPAYQAHPMLTTVALSRRLNRERFGSYTARSDVARFVKDALPQVYRLHIPADMVADVYRHDLATASERRSRRGGVAMSGGPALSALRDHQGYPWRM